jgi:hypothetical protein
MPSLPYIAEVCKSQIKKERDFLVTPTKEFHVLELLNGRVFIETISIDDEGVILEELLVSKDSKNFILLKRNRRGDSYSHMQSYERDRKFPIGIKVRL